MKQVKTAILKNEVFIIPTFGLLKVKEYKGLYKERWRLNLCFAWLIWRVA